MAESSYIRCDRKVKFECARCGRCCTDFFINLGFTDIVRLKEKYPGLDGLLVNARGMNPYTGKVENKISLPNPCKFYDSTGKACAAYGSRPKTCMIFPFYAKNENGKLEFYFEKNCPGVGKGKKVDLLEIYSVIKDLNGDIKLLESRKL
jgi:Fe-S-cluster containining protein